MEYIQRFMKMYVYTCFIKQLLYMIFKSIIICIYNATKFHSERLNYV